MTELLFCVGSYVELKNNSNVKGYVISTLGNTWVEIGMYRNSKSGDWYETDKIKYSKRKVDYSERNY